jgi:hypothetical protein
MKNVLCAFSITKRNTDVIFLAIGTHARGFGHVGLSFINFWTLVSCFAWAFLDIQSLIDFIQALAREDLALVALIEPCYPLPLLFHHLLLLPASWLSQPASCPGGSDKSRI